MDKKEKITIMTARYNRLKGTEKNVKSTGCCAALLREIRNLQKEV